MFAKTEMNPLTPILDRLQLGQAQTAAELLPLVYEELRKLAAQKMARAPAGHTLQPTALVHEAWLRLVGSGSEQWENRRHFFAAAVEAMRRILIERARKRLTAKRGGGAVPKVIDLGIAKATEQRLTDKTLFTAFDQFIGTPAYTSPEQAEMSGLDIDTRSDIYALGVLLYELLTGTTPFDPKELMAAGLDEMRRTIREQEPVRLSRRLSTMLAGELTATAQHRQAEPPKLIHLVRGDLDWIVMKCLEKDRTRRYETANGLAHDIERHLHSEPVVARPPSKLYRFQKLVRRSKVAFAAAAAVALALVLGIVATGWQAVRATRAEREQKLARQLAEKAREAEAIERQEAEKATAYETEQRQRAQEQTRRPAASLRLAHQPRAESGPKITWPTPGHS
jgi:RNA polymerase sigma factor (TIGR02999 family)